MCASMLSGVRCRLKKVLCLVPVFSNIANTLIECHKLKHTLDTIVCVISTLLLRKLKSWNFYLPLVTIGGMGSVFGRGRCGFVRQ